MADCVMPLQTIRAKPPVDDLMSQKSADEIRQCLITEFTRNGRAPVSNGNELWFSDMSGPVFHYVLTPVDGGTHVVTRRHDIMQGGLDKGRACYR
jgi:hypothetical protein